MEFFVLSASPSQEVPIKPIFYKAVRAGKLEPKYSQAVVNMMHKSLMVFNSVFMDTLSKLQFDQCTIMFRPLGTHSLVLAVAAYSNKVRQDNVLSHILDEFLKYSELLCGPLEELFKNQFTKWDNLIGKTCKLWLSTRDYNFQWQILSNLRLVQKLSLPNSINSDKMHRCMTALESQLGSVDCWAMFCNGVLCGWYGKDEQVWSVLRIACINGHLPWERYGIGKLDIIPLTTPTGPKLLGWQISGMWGIGVICTSQARNFVHAALEVLSTMTTQLEKKLIEAEKPQTENDSEEKPKCLLGCPLQKTFTLPKLKKRRKRLQPKLKKLNNRFRGLGKQTNNEALCPISENAPLDYDTNVVEDCVIRGPMLTGNERFWVLRGPRGPYSNSPNSLMSNETWHLITTVLDSRQVPKFLNCRGPLVYKSWCKFINYHNSLLQCHAIVTECAGTDCLASLLKLEKIQAFKQLQQSSLQNRTNEQIMLVASSVNVRNCLREKATGWAVSFTTSKGKDPERKFRWVTTPARKTTRGKGNDRSNKKTSKQYFKNVMNYTGNLPEEPVSIVS
eukprot:Platyproteum_vivax@DN3236_c0_g1_i1.p1